VATQTDSTVTTVVPALAVTTTVAAGVTTMAAADVKTNTPGHSGLRTVVRSPVIARGNASFEILGAPASVWWRRLWASPWVGNYRFNPDGTVGFLDLGCATVWTRGDHRLWIPASPSSPAHARRLIKKSARMLDNAPFKFSPADGLAHFEKLGWTPANMESVLLAARRFHRLPRVMRLVAYIPQPNPRKLGNMP